MLGLSRIFQEDQTAVPPTEGPPNLKEMLFHHMGDGKVLEFELLGRGVRIPLPEWEWLQFGGLDLNPTKHIVFLFLAAILLLVVFIPIGRAMRGKYTTSAPTGLANAMEALVLYFRDEVVRRSIGKGADAFVPYILTLFFLILAMNLLGLMPWGATPTANLSVTAALALVSFVVVEVTGMVSLGFKGYMGTIFYVPPGLSPVWKAILVTILTPVELLES